MSECVLFCGDAVTWRELLPVIFCLGGALLAGYLTADEDWIASVFLGVAGSLVGVVLGLVVVYVAHDPEVATPLFGFLAIGLAVFLGRWLRLGVYAVKRVIDEAAWRAFFGERGSHE